MADKEDVVLTSAAAITADVASRKRRQERRSCWVRQLGTSNKCQSSRVRQFRLRIHLQSRIRLRRQFAGSRL